ncbi:MAG TPA: RNA chaperone Hfq [Candidatus Xenobia bacterium]|nr:RNA chaperone Hfq [Candidatus Xenobia bacterium]
MNQQAHKPPGPPNRDAANIQDGFLNQLRRDRLKVTIFLMSGDKLVGRVKSFDKFSLLLESEGQEQLIFKHAIATVVVSKASAGGTPQGQG